MTGQRAIELVLRNMDGWLKFLVIAGTGIYIAEVATGARDSYHSHPFFLWAERVIAVIFTIEYFLRWYDDATDHYGWHYPQSPLGIIDLISILPFWVGFFVPPEYLHLIRTLRIFRLLKFFRYSRSLQLVALGFYRAWHHLRALGFAMMVAALFCTVAMYEIEQPAQPEKFSNLFDSLYFTMVTVATVGYGDLSPVTVLGRTLAMLTFVFALSIFAGMLGVLGNSFVKVLEEEADPNIDPIEEFHKERERILKMKAAEKKYGPKYSQLLYGNTRTPKERPEQEVPRNPGSAA